MLCKKLICFLETWINQKIKIPIFDWYLLQLHIRLKPGFNFGISFALSSLDNVTNCTQSFVSAILNVAATLHLTEFFVKATVRLISQFNDMWRVPKIFCWFLKMLFLPLFYLQHRYFLYFLFKWFCLNDSELSLSTSTTLFPFGLSVWYYHKLPNI